LVRAGALILLRMRRAHPGARSERLKLRTLAAVLLALVSVARPSFAAPPALDLPQIERFRLANGLDVVLERNHRQPRVAVVMAYDVGSRDDPPGYAGLAHLVEHLTYRGSRHLGSYQGPDLLEAAGAGEMNGKTEADRTVYYAVVPAGALELALFIESERMAFTLEAFNERAFELERSIVANELRLRDSVELRFFGYMRTALYGEDHPYARSSEADQDLDHIKLSDAAWFFQAAYRPDRAHLVVVGNFEPNVVKALIARYFGSVQNPAAPALVRPVLKPPSFSARRVRFLYPGFSDLLAEVRPAPVSGANSHVAAELFARIVYHRLGVALVERQGLASGVSTELMDLGAGSELWTWATPRVGASSAALEQALDHELGAMAALDFGQVLPETKAELRLQEVERLEDPLRRAWAHLGAIATQGAPFDTSERLRALQAVTESEVRAVAAELTSANHVLGTLVRASPNRALDPEGEVTYTP
jgi:zinc protease